MYQESVFSSFHWCDLTDTTSIRTIEPTVNESNSTTSKVQDFLKIYLSSGPEAGNSMDQKVWFVALNAASSILISSVFKSVPSVAEIQTSPSLCGRFSSNELNQYVTNKAHLNLKGHLYKY